MALHVFVAMPFGNKENINFDRVYTDLIKSALEDAGFEVFRADEESRAGNIRTDMFQELLLADLVVTDLSIDNPNVWYELGVRHALRARGVILMHSKREKQPFDIYTDRKLQYHLKNGVPDTDHLENDKKALAEMARQTAGSWHGRKDSPVYQHLKYLQEPTWKALKVDEAREFWEQYEQWENHVTIARRKNRPGDILVLADETPVTALKMEAYRRAGKALTKLGQFSFALEQYERALKINPEDLESLQQKGVLLGRLKKHDNAELLLNELADKHPEDPETRALLGRVEKDKWVYSWRMEGKSSKEMFEDAHSCESQLHQSIRAYVEGFQIDPGHYYSGINAVTLMYLLRYLNGDIKEFDQLPALEGAVRWAVLSALKSETVHNKDFWARVTLGDLEVLMSDTESVEKAYNSAMAASENDWFSLDSSRQQLLLLKDLDFRPEQVGAALKIFNSSFEKLRPPWRPRKVFLFSGHMIDAPGRSEPRFPPEKEQIAAEAIYNVLREQGAGPEDLGLCGGACGGDILFAEACMKLGLPTEIRVAFDEPAFLAKSVTFAGENWRDRYYTVKNNPLAKLLVMPDELGKTPEKVNPYERNNLWQLCTALAWGPEKVHFICLWNRKGGDGPGGTKHMHDEVNKRTGQVHVLDTNNLF